MQSGFKAAALVMAVAVVALAGCPQEQKEDAQSLPPGQGSGSTLDTQTGQAQDDSMDDVYLGWVGDAVDFSCTTFDGGQFRASESGKPVIINFWAAW